MNSNRTSDWSHVFEISDTTYDGLHSSLSMRLSELEAVTLLLAQNDKEHAAVDPDEMAQVFWHLHHCVVDAKSVFNKFTDITARKSED